LASCSMARALWRTALVRMRLKAPSFFGDGFACAPGGLSETQALRTAIRAYAMHGAAKRALAIRLNAWLSGRVCETSALSDARQRIEHDASDASASSGSLLRPAWLEGIARHDSSLAIGLFGCSNGTRNINYGIRAA
jgi:hypothetical protein